jgi:hypothetical protein
MEQWLRLLCGAKLLILSDAESTPTDHLDRVCKVVRSCVWECAVAHRLGVFPVVSVDLGHDDPGCVVQHVCSHVRRLPVVRTRWRPFAAFAGCRWGVTRPRGPFVALRAVWRVWRAFRRPAKPPAATPGESHAAPPPSSGESAAKPRRIAPQSRHSHAGCSES